MAKKSPSSRRAWIEIIEITETTDTNHVALLAEGVDRNQCKDKSKSLLIGRPPRGGRG